MQHSSLAAVRLTRKAASVGVFHGTNLEYARARYLPTPGQGARDTLKGFLAWTTSHFNIEIIVIEKVDRPDAARVEDLAFTVTEFAARENIPIWQVSKSAVIGSYAEPAPKTRTDMRAVAAKIWPMLTDPKDNPLDLEAAALGLYAQIERKLTTPP